ncbi:TrkH family potassium uptake protein [Christensenella hongkongensis]|uniref:Potassium uptake protein, integral membrane component, KtrB n=2 Tax=Christensenella hongkongensis TaxID=270498 RepID=A0A0M2NFV1_9FIRM|nr:potassium transporter TrkG [Christensenella hongkongensis]KKI51028.1 Potassium uptake protein, integral membrane component, KtrB [Christensenella hongkongensis]TCW30558.1 trk system potassium uptake protein TrkH [Christensenella hongkongensis]
MIRKRRRLNPAEILVFGFGGMIVIGGLLLCLPIASSTGESVGILPAFFSSTSAICVTGLSVVEIGTAYSLFGQIVMLILIQLGGIGFMTATSMVYMLLGRRITLKDRMVIKDSLNETNLQGVVHMTRNVLLVTLLTEVAGILLLSIRFIPEYGFGQGLYYSIFHSISSFCNAGFDVFGLGNSLVPYAYDPLVTITVMALITVGGLGFFVVVELYRKALLGRKYHLKLHTKIVLIVSGVLVLAGFLFFLALESNNPKTLGAEGLSAGDKVLGAMFQSVTPRTAGYATIPQADLTPASKIATTALMFIGASPSGTGGGIKTTTAVMLLFLVATIVTGKQDTVVMKRRINKDVMMRAITIATLALVFVGVMVTLISIVDQSHVSVSDILFETVSAFGTVGLSTGITASLSPFSQVLLMITMFGGRVGVFTMSMAVAKRMSHQDQCSIRYPEDRVMIG